MRLVCAFALLLFSLVSPVLVVHTIRGAGVGLENEFNQGTQ